MEAQVYKIHSDFYYVKNSNNETFTCKLKEILKKQKKEVVVGDFVELNKDNSVIVSILKRKNYLQKPKVANLDYILIIASPINPELDLVQIDRYLCYFKYHKIDCAICFNKMDLICESDNFIKNIENIYKKLNYKIFYISAKEKTNILPLKRFLKNKTVALCGMSGVGKTTLTNIFNNSTKRKTGSISSKTLTGVHTTRYCEKIECKNFNIIDTPGFSKLKFDFLLPKDLINLFDDLKIYKNECKYSDCLHNNLSDENCSIIKNFDKITKSRYESYIAFLGESIKYKEKISNSSIKKEELNKTIANRKVTKISKKDRTLARNTIKQKIKNIKEIF